MGLYTSLFQNSSKFFVSSYLKCHDFNYFSLLFKKIVAYFILDAFMDLFIYICIVLNTLFLALDQHNPNPTLFYVLSVGNYVFTSIFAAEAFLKIIALSPTKYLENKWNIFDIIIVSIISYNLLI